VFPRKETFPVASRLYRTTRPLYLQVTGILDRLGVARTSSPTTAILIALYVTGLLLLDARPTQTRATRVLPGRCHDALNRLLRTTPWSTRALLGRLVAWIRQTNTPGYLCLDDVVVEKAFAKRLPWAGWTYSFANKRKVDGLHVVVLLWCSADGGYRIPVAFRLWRPKRTCAPAAYQTKPQLAWGMLTGLAAARLPFSCLVVDTHYAAGWFTRRAGRLGICWSAPCTHGQPWSGTGSGRQSPSWPGGCGWTGGRGLACARPRSRSPRPSTGRCGWW
jgi:hypothetical protein